MSPKKAPTTRSESTAAGLAMPPHDSALPSPEIPPVDDQLDDEDSIANDDSATPITSADIHHLLDRIVELEHWEFQDAREHPLEPPSEQFYREPQVAPPPEFYGKASEYRNFMSQVALAFALCQRLYSGHERKVLFVISRLRGRVLDWARDIPINLENPYRKDYPTFKCTLDNIYLDRNYRDLCEDKINNLTHPSSVA